MGRVWYPKQGREHQQKGIHVKRKWKEKIHQAWIERGAALNSQDSDGEQRT